MVAAVVEGFGYVDILGLQCRRSRPVAQRRRHRSRRARARRPHACPRPAPPRRLVLPSMRERPRGDIVMISSVATSPMAANGAPYNMGKAAFEALALHARARRSAARHPRQHRGPGAGRDRDGPASDEGRRASTDLRALDAAMPFGRVCQPDDVAEVVLYLVTDAAATSPASASTSTAAVPAEMPDELDDRVELARAAYADRRPRSAAASLAAAEVLPAGSTRSVLAWCRSRSGSRMPRDRLIDVDGHEYIDFLGDYSAGLLGHDPSPLRLRCAARSSGGGATAGSRRRDPLRRGACRSLPVDRAGAIHQLGNRGQPDGDPAGPPSHRPRQIVVFDALPRRPAVLRPRWRGAAAPRSTSVASATTTSVR